MELELIGRPYFRVECHCTSCRSAVSIVEGLAAPVSKSYSTRGGMDYCAFMQDAVQFKQVCAHSHKMTPKTKDLRL